MTELFLHELQAVFGVFFVASCSHYFKHICDGNYWCSDPFSFLFSARSFSIDADSFKSPIDVNSVSCAVCFHIHIRIHTCKHLEVLKDLLLIVLQN